MARLIALALFFCAVPLHAASLYDPAYTWRTLSTPRFAVHYPDGAYNLAVRVGRIAEEVLDEDGALFGFTPEGVIDVVLVDNVDDANGSAQVLPRNTLRLFLAAPTELTGLSEYDDWLRILLVHELAHLCDLDQSWGFTRVLRWVFGKYIAMNWYVPQFLSEGVAVYAETLLTPTGRGRSSYVAMLLREAALSGKFIDIDQANIQYSDWPGPNAAYFYGGAFHLWLLQRFGAAAVRDLHQYYAAMPLPYLYWFGARGVLGDSLPSLWDEWRQEETRFAREVEAGVVARGVTASTRLTFHGRNITGARYSPDGKFIVYSRTSPVDGSTVRQVARDGSGDRALVLETFSPRFSFGDQAFYFSQSAVNQRFNDFNDLYRYDLAKDEQTRLRSRAAPDLSLRARDPDVSPDGKRIVFVQNRLHQSWVSVGTFVGDDELDVRILVPPHGDMQQASPRFSPDGKVVAVSTWFLGGHRDIVLVDAESGALVRRVTDDAALDGNPAWSPDGRYVLYESDASGISNIYAYDTQAQQYFRVTNVVGGAFQPDVAPDGSTLLFRNASGDGFDIHEMRYAPDTWTSVGYDPARGYTEGAVSVDPTWASAPLPTALPRDAEPPLALGPSEHDAPYTPWGSLLPLHDNWVLVPALYFLNDDPSFSLATVGTDALLHHGYFLRAGSSYYTQRLNFTAQYWNDSWYPTFSAGVGELSLSYATRNDRVAERRRTGVLGVSLPVAERHLLGLSYVYEDRHGLTADAKDFLALGNFAYAEAGYRYRLARRFPYSVSDEHGVSAAIAGRYYSRALGADFDELMLTLDGRAYVNNPLFDNHVLALRLAGALAFGPDFEERFALGGAGGSSVFSVTTESVYPLRGFPLDVELYPPGAAVVAGYAEYRFPLAQVERGLWTLPFYLERVHGALFADLGSVVGEEASPNFARVTRRLGHALLRPRLGAGGEVRADLSLGWAVPLTLRLGVGLPVLDDGRPVLHDVRKDAVIYFSFGSAI